MFQIHQKRISDYGRQNPENMARVLKFVIVTIRNRLFNCPADMATLDSGGETADEINAVLYGFKLDSIQQIDAEADSLYWQAEEIVYHATSEREAAAGLLNLFTSIHGFGLAKAGFACQLLYGVSACLDSHNIARFGIPWAHMKSSTFKNCKKNATRQKWIQRYCDYVEQCGGTESLWDSWCDFVYNRPDETGFKMNGNQAAYKSAYHVSALHCESLGLAAD
jgi:hypothetical protein